MGEFLKIVGEMPWWFWVAFWFFIGSFVGSFINVVVYRLPRNCLSVNKPSRSFCPSCKTQLKAKDNLPIIGWALLRGKCRYCGVKYGIRYPLVELLVATLFAVSSYAVLYDYGARNLAADPWAWLTLVYVLGIIGVLVPWALIDFDLTYIPDKLTLGPLVVFVPLGAHAAGPRFGLGSGVDHLLFKFEPTWLNSMLSVVVTGVLAALALWLIGKIAKVVFRKRAAEIGGEAMGLADVKLMILLGVMLGWPKLVAGFFIAIFVGATLGIIQLALKKGHGVPFGPHLAFGAITATLAMPWLLAAADWYMELLGGLAK
ncbi:MAG: prepilin peptidase [Planctomycetes bacterium]|nr:prepilin peptidase [Planctomycetota bacterium]MCW8134299.1 prepilin peptidase [Planctomycetota bacterium]